MWRGRQECGSAFLLALAAKTPEAKMMGSDAEVDELLKKLNLNEADREGAMFLLSMWFR